MLWLNAMILGSSLQQHTSSKRIGPCASRTEFGSMWNILVEMTPWWPQRGVLVMKPCMMYVKSKKIYAYLQQKCKEHTRTPSRHSVQVNKHVNLSGSSVLQKLIGWQLLWCCVDKLPSLRRVLLAAYHGAVANWGSGGSWQVQWFRVKVESLYEFDWTKTHFINLVQHGVKLLNLKLWVYLQKGFPDEISLGWGQCKVGDWFGYAFGLPAQRHDILDILKSWKCSLLMLDARGSGMK